MTSHLFARLSVEWWRDDDIDCSLAARGLFTLLLTYSADNLTDGKLTPKAFARATVGEDRAECDQLAEQLMDTNLLKRTRSGGFEIVNYSKWQTTREEITAKREAAAERARNSRKNRKNRTTTPPSHDTVTRDAGARHNEVTQLETEVETEEEPESDKHPPRCEQDRPQTGPGDGITNGWASTAITGLRWLDHITPNQLATLNVEITYRATLESSTPSAVADWLRNDLTTNTPTGDIRHPAAYIKSRLANFKPDPPRQPLEPPTDKQLAELEAQAADPDRPDTNPDNVSAERMARLTARARSHRDARVRTPVAQRRKNVGEF